MSTGFIGNTRPRRKIYGITGALLTLVFPFFLMLATTGSHLESEQSLCPFKLLTGFPCPGCGITKSLVFLYEGDLGKSLHYHILGPFVVLFSVFIIFVLSAELATGKEYFRSVFYNRKLAYFLGMVLTVYHLIRLINFITVTSWHEIVRQSVWG
ncbi:MAG TPA: DUF2752 domain-containing protein [Flavobacterium sp.]|jgi:hypothetical protein